MFKHLDNYADDCSPGVSDTQGKEIRELDGDVYDDDDDAAPDADDDSDGDILPGVSDAHGREADKLAAVAGGFHCAHDLKVN